MTTAGLGGNMDHWFDGRPKAVPKLALGRVALRRNDSDKKIPSVREALNRLTMRRNDSDKKIPSVREAVGRLTLKRNDSEKRSYLPREAISRLTMRRNAPDKNNSPAWEIPSRCLSSTSTRVPSTASSRSHSARCSGSGAPSAASSRCHSARELGPPASSAASARGQNSARGQSPAVATSTPARGPSAVAKHQSKADELSALPGSLQLTRQNSAGNSESLSGSGQSSYVDVAAAEVASTCSLLSWKSPPPPCPSRLYRIEGNARRRSVCQQPKAIEPTGTAAPGGTALDAPVQASLAEESPVLAGFPRLKLGKLAEDRKRRSTTWFSKPPVSMRRFGLGFDAESQVVSLGGLFAEEVFKHYDSDHNGLLSAAELASMLRDHGMCLDYTGASRILDLIAGIDDTQGIGFEEFPRCVMGLVEKRRGSGGEAAEVLQCVFRSYDANKSEMLEVPEYTQLLNHLGCKPRTKKEWANQGVLVASCRGDPVPGPLNFQEFVVLARKIHAGRS